MGYEVGRGKPPIHGQFQKGQSGNPTGARKNHTLLLLRPDTNQQRIEDSLNMDILKKIRETLTFALTCTVKELKEANRNSDYLPVYKAILYGAILKATKKGDTKFIKFLFKQVIGKV